MNWPITTISRTDKKFPKRLAQIHDAPEILYCRGNIKLLGSSCFGVIGTRAMTSYGKEAAERLTCELSAQGLTIVSGLALGIDSVAHRAALDTGGATIAVLGGGIDDKTIQPTAHRQLSNNILERDGLLISEYPAGYPPDKWTFPQRNRIISGLSIGVLVVEADEESGSLITAKCALDQNRDVFAIPGNIFSPRSKGTNLLIQQGAKLVLSANDILQEYGQEPLIRSSATSISTQNPTEQKILAILREAGTLHIDGMIAAINCSAPEALAAVSTLEIHGIIKHTGNGNYRLCN